MSTRRALVVGAGIAGLATALRLRRGDWDVVLAEPASTSRTSGFPCAFDGIGRDAAARLGLLPRLVALSQPRCDTVLGDALEIFAETAEALVWWENQMRPVLRHIRRPNAVRVLPELGMMTPWM